MDHFGRQITDSVTKSIDDFFKGLKDFIFEASLTQFFPDLFNRIHLGGVWGNKKEFYVWGYTERTGFVPSRPVAA